MSAKESQCDTEMNYFKYKRQNIPTVTNLIPQVLKACSAFLCCTEALKRFIQVSAEQAVRYLFCVKGEHKHSVQPHMIIIVTFGCARNPAAPLQ